MTCPESNESGTYPQGSQRLKTRVGVPAPWTILFGSRPLVIPVTGSTVVAATGLRSVLHPRFPLVTGGLDVVGRVSGERVTVRVRRRWSFAGVAPVFVGNFAVVSGRPSLQGAFRLSRSSQLQFVTSFAFLLVCAVLVVPGVFLGLAEPGAAWGLPVLLFLWAAALGELYASWWRGERDRAEIERRLRQVLSNGAA
jgi:hypothetical protein